MSPTLSREDYVRPDQDWVCGHACDGSPCRIGPSPRGKCRATFECAPRLDLKPGESKGIWACTRPKTAGGHCENGPLPDGACCNPIPPCQPRRTLRAIRKRVTIFAVLASLLILLVSIGSNFRDDFINPGPLSSVHASEHFARTHKAMAGEASSCTACHEGAGQSGDPWHSKGIDAVRGGLAPAELIKKGPLRASPMDQNCLACHLGRDFHQPNMPAEFACHACHKEHQTSGFMPDVNSNYCTACHGDAALMAKARKLGAGINPLAFPNPAPGVSAKAQDRKRPAGGYTDTITAFHVDHPDFRLVREQARDVNTLKFNHAVHLGKTIPELDGLSCKDCHEPEAPRSEYQRPISYEKHCARCHALQFDPDTEDLHLPHGDPFYVRSFIRSLNIQYAEYGLSKKGITGEAELNEYVKEKVANLQKHYENDGENLERAVFFANKEKKRPGGDPAYFFGCAACHTVSKHRPDSAAPLIAKVAVPDRWLTLGKFNHDLHRKDLTCLDCHDVTKSEETSDLNLPSITTCVKCHSPEGGIDHRCIRCHTYHNNRDAKLGSNPAKTPPRSTSLFERLPGSSSSPDSQQEPPRD